MLFLRLIISANQGLCSKMLYTIFMFANAFCPVCHISGILIFRPIQRWSSVSHLYKQSLCHVCSNVYHPSSWIFKPKKQPNRCVFGGLECKNYFSVNHTQDWLTIRNDNAFNCYGELHPWTESYVYDIMYDIFIDIHFSIAGSAQCGPGLYLHVFSYV